MNVTSASKKRRRFALLSCAAIFLFCAALYQAQRFTALSDCVQARFQEPALTIEALRKGLENARKYKGDVTDATIWDERKDQRVSGAQSRSAALRVLLVYRRRGARLQRPFSFGRVSGAGRRYWLRRGSKGGGRALRRRKRGGKHADLSGKDVRRARRVCRHGRRRGGAGG